MSTVPDANINADFRLASSTLPRSFFTGKCFRLFIGVLCRDKGDIKCLLVMTRVHNPSPGRLLALAEMYSVSITGIVYKIVLAGFAVRLYFNGCNISVLHSLQMPVSRAPLVLHVALRVRHATECLP